MLYDNIKSNLNRIDFELKELYGEVSISEKVTPNKFYFQILAKGNFEGLFESNDNREVKTIVLIEKNNLNFETVNWKYCVNPENPNSDFIERVSKIEELAKDIHSTVTKKQMDINYLRNTPVVFEKINESLQESVLENSHIDQILRIVESFLDIEDIEFENNYGNKHLKIYHNGIKVSDKFVLESKLNKLDNVNFVSYIDDTIRINYND